MDLYSRIISLLRIFLPLAALVLLSTVFMMSQRIRPTAPIPFAPKEIEDRIAGHQVTAIYEVTPVGSDARLTDPLRYGAATEGRDPSELGFLRLRHKTPGVEESQLIETPILADMDEISQDARFGIAIAGFGQILRGSDLMGDWSIDDAIGLATDTRGTDPFGYRQEAIGLMRLASSLTD